MPTGTWFNGTASDGSVAWDDESESPTPAPTPTPTPTPTPAPGGGIPILFTLNPVQTSKFKTVTPINGEGSWF